MDKNNLNSSLPCQTVKKVRASSKTKSYIFESSCTCVCNCSDRGSLGYALNGLVGLPFLPINIVGLHSLLLFGEEFEDERDVWLVFEKEDVEFTKALRVVKFCDGDEDVVTLEILSVSLLVLWCLLCRDDFVATFESVRAPSSAASAAFTKRLNLSSVLKFLKSLALSMLLSCSFWSDELLLVFAASDEVFNFLLVFVFTLLPLLFEFVLLLLLLLLLPLVFMILSIWVGKFVWV